MDFCRHTYVYVFLRVFRGRYGVRNRTVFPRDWENQSRKNEVLRSAYNYVKIRYFHNGTGYEQIVFQRISLSENNKKMVARFSISAFYLFWIVWNMFEIICLGLLKFTYVCDCRWFFFLLINMYSVELSCGKNNNPIGCFCSQRKTLEKYGKCVLVSNQQYLPIRLENAFENHNN